MKNSVLVAGVGAAMAYGMGFGFTVLGLLWLIAIVVEKAQNIF